ncbi:hypothetical protein [Palleronia sp. THAF1]|uniref:hypothetical protein n=1 Tax=Palleronia sp. THAF1 TaxID=2587842 RepID=UPI000F522D65|nr:hypothetical protein [Palleronia sp. THAF1]
MPVKLAERQAAPLDHVAPEVRLWRNARHFLVRQRTQIVNAIRAHLAEFGVVVANGIHDVDSLLDAACDMPDAARPALDMLSDQLRDTRDQPAGIAPAGPETVKRSRSSLSGPWLTQDPAGQWMAQRR